MITPAYVQLMAQYNRWMNERMYALADELGDDLRMADRGAFFGSVHGTLDHLVRGDLNWLARFNNEALPDFGPEALVCATWPVLQARRTEVDDQIDRWAQAVSDAWLQAPFSWYSAMYDRDMHMPAWIAVSHFFNHQTHHRGQLTTLFTQLGVDPGITDLPMMPTLESAGTRR
ncbi:putative damage-inducible protein DinB [Silvimonas terrae]|uniref:Putative damage-inducible protein DinB n=1 Tax=Silvimonas terrae TaxID=300266 RepID=A0A840RN70_9NEIS|nr:DinB family protein [Silvimonas terrae]MBB5193632.1 putative damage-inducible protein DinB [Silvimonas terrae]